MPDETMASTMLSAAIKSVQFSASFVMSLFASFFLQKLWNGNGFYIRLCGYW